MLGQQSPNDRAPHPIGIPTQISTWNMNSLVIISYNMSTFLVPPCAVPAYIYKILDNHNKNLSKANLTLQKCNHLARSTCAATPLYTGNTRIKWRLPIHQKTQQACGKNIKRTAVHTLNFSTSATSSPIHAPVTSAPRKTALSTYAKGGLIGQKELVLNIRTKCTFTSSDLTCANTIPYERFQLTYVEYYKN